MKASYCKVLAVVSASFWGGDRSEAWVFIRSSGCLYMDGVIKEARAWVMGARSALVLNGENCKILLVFMKTMP